MKKPYMVCAVLDIVPRAAEWNDHTLHRFFYRLGKGGVDYLRIFPFWDGLKPYRKRPAGHGWSWVPVCGEYDLDLWNPDYFYQLKRVCAAAHEWRIAIYFDLFDHCATKSYYEPQFGKNPWYHNHQRVDGIYKIDPIAMRNYKMWIKKVWDTVGKRGYWKDKFGIKHKIKHNLFGLGNELRFPGDRKGLHDWANTWGYGLAEYMRTLGYTKEVLWSAEQKTGHALREYISPAGWYVSKCHGAPYVVAGEGTTHWYECMECRQPCDLRFRGGHKFRYKDTVEQWHGWYRHPAALEVMWNTSQGRKLGFSDDGTNVREMDSQGLCVDPPANRRFCSASTSIVVHTCKKMKLWLDVMKHKHPPKWFSIEQLPRSVSEIVQSLDDLNQDRDVNIYRCIAKQVWGKDITRRYPKWLREKHGIKG